MATMEVTPEDYAFFNLLYPYVFPNISNECLVFARKCVENGIIQIETLLENALANCANGLYHKESTAYRDFSDNSDAKKFVSQFRNNNKKRGTWTNSFIIRGLGNKIGMIRGVGYSKVAEQFFYFAIPHEAYLGLDQIEIQLDQFNGHFGDKEELTPLGFPRGKWSKYQVGSFEELAKKS